MTREIQASMGWTAELLPALALHRLVPERSLPEVVQAAAQVGAGARLMLFHLQGCEGCVRAALVEAGRVCDRGRRLLEGCHGWRDRSRA
jgi:hypothetical protein